MCKSSTIIKLTLLKKKIKLKISYLVLEKVLPLTFKIMPFKIKMITCYFIMIDHFLDKHNSLQEIRDLIGSCLKITFYFINFQEILSFEILDSPA